MSDTPEVHKADKPKRRWRVSRRGFLIGVGVTGVAVALGWRFGLPEARLRVAGLLDNAAAPGSIDASPTAWFEVSQDNQLTLHMPKVEMGQGIHTALKQIAIEELELPWENLLVVSASTSRGVNDPFGTGGSSTVSSLFVPLREAAATLREMFKAKAAEQWDAEPSDIMVMDGELFLAADTSKRTNYGELASTVADWEVPRKAPELKEAREFQFIGKPMQRVDFESKLTGRAVYGYDARMPGMLYGAVARPPSFTSALKAASAGDAAAQPGVVAVVIEDDFAGVVAESRLQAYAALEHLELEWQQGEVYQQADLDAMTEAAVDRGGTVIQREGRVGAHLKDDVFEAHYHSPFAAHAHLEPQAAIVDVRADGVTALVATQAPQLVRNEIAEVLGRDKEAVDVTATYLGGGFGRRLNVEVALEAARMSRAVTKPVHVGWNRSEEFRHGYLRPATYSHLQAKLKGQGVLALQHRQASGDVAFPFFPQVAASFLGADFGAWRGATVQYGIAHRRTIAHRVTLPLRTGWWRGLGLLCNTFAVECFIDELAHEVSVDPLEFRLNHLPEGEQGERYRRVLERLAQDADWGGPVAEGRARGIAVSSDVNTIVGQVAEVSVENGQIRVHQMHAVMDPGFVINPDGCVAQTQGSIVMGLSSTLKESITIKDSQVEAANFDRYSLLTIKETPEIHVSLINSGDTPFGVGEPPMGPVAAAVGNAVFTLTGQRLRSLPLKLA